MAEAPPEDVVDELYGAPLDEFISRRDARAKELRKENRAASDAVKRLRKPSVSAAAVNRLAREAPDDVEGLLAAGEALRQAQLGGGDREAIRDAARQEREAVDRLIDKAGPTLSPSAAEEARETLHAAASDDEARELIRRGVLTEARRAVGLGGFGAAVAPVAPEERRSRSKQGAKEEKGKKANEAAARAKREEAEAERRRAAKERVKAARAALRDAERAAAEADRERKSAQKTLDQAQRRADAAAEAVERRREQLEASERDAALQGPAWQHPRS